METKDKNAVQVQKDNNLLTENETANAAVSAPNEGVAAGRKISSVQNDTAEETNKAVQNGEGTTSGNLPKKKQKKCIHDGHRQRLIELVETVGLENVTKIQAMEYFLFYVFPRGDVNPLAHDLLDRFDNFTGVVDAEPTDLKTVFGVSDLSAKKIAGFEDMFFYYMECKLSKKFRVHNKADLMDVVEDLLRFRSTEQMLLLAISPSNIITHKRRISINRQEKVLVNMLEIGLFLASTKTSGLVVAHCHPYGSAKPSKQDMETFQEMQKFCFTIGVRLIDSFIVGEDGVFGHVNNKMMRTFVDVEELKNVIDFQGL